MLLKTVMHSYSVGFLLGSEFENRRLSHVPVLCTASHLFLTVRLRYTSSATVLRTCLMHRWDIFFNSPTTFVSEGGIASKDGRTFSRTSSNARATSTMVFRVTSNAGDDGMVSRQTASLNASQSPLLSLVRRTAHGPISPGVTSLCEPTCEIALSFHFGFVHPI